MPFILPTLLGFQGSVHLLGVGSFSYNTIILKVQPNSVHPAMTIIRYSATSWAYFRFPALPSGRAAISPAEKPHESLRAAVCHEQCQIVGPFARQLVTINVKSQVFPCQFDCAAKEVLFPEVAGFQDQAQGRVVQRCHDGNTGRNGVPDPIGCVAERFGHRA